MGEYIKQVRTEKGIGITKIDKDLFDGSTRYSWFEGRPSGLNVPTSDDYKLIKDYLGLDDRFDFLFDLDKTNVVDEIPMTFGIGSSQERHGDTKKITEPSTELAKKYEGSKLGFQPKPAREIVVVGMKPFKEKSYIDKVLNFEALPENIQRTYPLMQTPKPSKKEKTIGTEKNIHPTVKPIKLMSYLITLFTREGDYVLDPFMGSGTTGLACKLLNRDFIGIDFTEEYCKIAEERLQVSRGELIKTLKIKIQNELF